MEERNRGLGSASKSALFSLQTSDFIHISFVYMNIFSLMNGIWFLLTAKAVHFSGAPSKSVRSRYVNFLLQAFSFLLEQIRESAPRAFSSCACASQVHLKTWDLPHIVFSFPSHSAFPGLLGKGNRRLCRYKLFSKNSRTANPAGHRRTHSEKTGDFIKGLLKL